MDERALDVLVTLMDLNIKTRLNAITAKELSERSECPSLWVLSSLYQSLDYLNNINLIAKGIRRNRAQTWYITQEGISYCESIFAEAESIDEYNEVTKL